MVIVYRILYKLLNRNDSAGMNVKGMNGMKGMNVEGIADLGKSQ